jgi:hypothetical protein
VYTTSCMTARYEAEVGGSHRGAMWAEVCADALQECVQGGYVLEGDDSARHCGPQVKSCQTTTACIRHAGVNRHNRSLHKWAAPSTATRTPSPL